METETSTRTGDPLLRKDDVLALFGDNAAAVGRDFSPPISRIAVSKWGDYLPPLRARQLLDRHPELADCVVDPYTDLSLLQMRQRLATPRVGGPAGRTRRA